MQGILCRTAEQADQFQALHHGGSTVNGALLNLYEWRPGRCFRCARSEECTMLLDSITPPAGGVYEIRACMLCVAGMEQERARYASRRGLHYVPGQLGKARRQTAQEGAVAGENLGSEGAGE